MEVINKISRFLIKRKPYHISIIKNPNEELQMLAVTQNPYTIKEIENPCFEAQKHVILINPRFLEIIKNPNYAIQKYAVSKDGYCLDFVEKKTHELVVLAVKNKPYIACGYIHNNDIREIAIRLDPDLISSMNAVPESLKELSVELKPVVIKKIWNPSEKLQMMALKRNPELIKNINSMWWTEKIKNYVNSINPKYIENALYWEKMYAEGANREFQNKFGYAMFEAKVNQKN